MEGSAVMGTIENITWVDERRNESVNRFFFQNEVQKVIFLKARKKIWERIHWFSCLSFGTKAYTLDYSWLFDREELIYTYFVADVFTYIIITIQW